MINFYASSFDFVPNNKPDLKNRTQRNSHVELGNLKSHQITQELHLQRETEARKNRGWRYKLTIERLVHKFIA